MRIRDYWGAAGKLRSRTLVWSIATGAALIASASFVQTLAEGYLMLAGIATLAALITASGTRWRQMRWPFLTALALAGFVSFAAVQRARIAAVDDSWDTISARMRENGLNRMLASLQSSLREVNVIASYWKSKRWDVRVCGIRAGFLVLLHVDG